MEKRKTMSYKNLWVLLVTALFVVLTATSVSAFGTVTSVEVNGVEALGTGIDLGVFSGEKLPVLVKFEATSNADDVRVKAWVSGDSSNIETTERFDVIAGNTYVRIMYLDVPEDLNDELDEERTLEILVESKANGIADQVTVGFHVQRESYILDILAVTMENEVKAGDTLVIDTVLKNKGRKLADDAFVMVRVPELGLETKTYFGDLSSLDQGGNEPDKEDAVERRTFLRFPSNVPAGLYTVVIDAFNSDSFDSMEKKVLVVGSEDDSKIFSSLSTKTFSLGETGEYSLTLVNKGSTIQIYDVMIDAPRELNVEASDSIVVVPAGSSRTITFTAETTAKAEDDETYSFTVSVNSEDGATVEQKVFRASIAEGSGKSSGSKTSGSTAVLLTVVLAIIFVVLLVVLIVLLTRKPDKSEEFGESYY
jgi:hypothetical protein